MFVWKVASLPPVGTLITLCHTYTISALCVKVANGTFKSNQVDPTGKEIGNDSYLLDGWIQPLKDAGIEIHGWHFIYTLPTASPGAQAGLSGERVQKLDLKSLKVDVEDDGGGGWKSSPYRNQSAKTYMAQVRPSGIALSYPLGICSYRRPDYHPEVPWGQFLKPDDGRVVDIAMQMYWQGDHNPAKQMADSMSAYHPRAHPSSPYEPVGSMYGVGDWLPTTDDITHFMQAAKDMADAELVWFYSLDWTLAHNKLEWLDAASKFLGVTPPILQPGLRFRVTTVANPYLNVRTGPNAGYPDVGDLAQGTEVLIADVFGQDAWGLIQEGPYAGRYVCIKQNVSKYLELV